MIIIQFLFVFFSIILSHFNGSSNFWNWFWIYESECFFKFLRHQGYFLMTLNWSKKSQCQIVCWTKDHKIDIFFEFPRVPPQLKLIYQQQPNLHSYVPSKHCCCSQIATRFTGFSRPKIRSEKTEQLLKCPEAKWEKMTRAPSYSD